MLEKMNKPRGPWRCTRCHRKLRAVVHMLMGLPFGSTCVRKEIAGA